MYQAQTATEVIPTKRIWVAKPFLIAYVIVVGFTVGLLVSRAPESPDSLPASAGADAILQTDHGGEREAREPPLWLQLFRPSQATARLLLRTAMPHLAIADGSALARQDRTLAVYWTGKYGEKPQTLFQTMLPFLRQVSAVENPVSPPEVAEPVPHSSGQTPAPEPADAEPVAPEPKPTAPAGRSKPAVNLGLPLVGIYHTHDYESYISEFPNLTPKTNKDLNSVVSYDHTKRTVVHLGSALAIYLRDEGITPVHAPFKHQDLGYDFAYRSSRDTVKEILSKAPSTRILLDIHRDGVMGMNSTTVIGGKKVAQIRCIIGQYEQPHWEKNKAFCDTLMTRLEKMYPGITMGTRVQNDTYNQDLVPGAILLEVGNAMNRFEEAERAVGYLAKALAAVVREGSFPK